ncbi:MAG: 50S ribosomal protein L9 [Chitinophagaceae bacterium]|jgi:large subunit ribosomal protein L9|nr:MAG: 50S ribosomal protein L9 [Chitinophagaceae bacterium]
MQVILIQDVNNLGGRNELVKVKNGYARNYLIPRKLAVEANPSNLKQLEERQKVQKRREDQMLQEIAKVKEVLLESPVKIGAKTGTTGKIFGSVTTLQISQAIKSQKGYEIDRRHIELLEEVKELGSYKAKINFGNQQELEMSFEVVAE